MKTWHSSWLLYQRLLMIAGHDKASIFKVKAMEAVDTAIGQLSHLQCVGWKTLLVPWVEKPSSWKLHLNHSLFQPSRGVKIKQKIWKWWKRSKQAFSGDSVSGFGEVAAARGCLGRFSGSEVIGIVQTYLKLKAWASE